MSIDGDRWLCHPLHETTIAFRKKILSATLLAKSLSNKYIKTMGQAQQKHTWASTIFTFLLPKTAREKNLVSDLALSHWLFQVVNILKSLCFFQKKKNELSWHSPILLLFYYSWDYIANPLLNHRSEITVGVRNQRTDKTAFKSVYQPNVRPSLEAVELDNIHCWEAS